MKKFVKLNNNDDHLSLGNFFRLIKEETKNKISAVQTELFSVLFKVDNINDTTINNYCVGYRTIGNDYKQQYLNYIKKYKNDSYVLLDIILNLTFIMEGNVSTFDNELDKSNYINKSSSVKNLITKLYNIAKNDKTINSETLKKLTEYKDNDKILFVSEVIFYIVLYKKQPIYEKDLKKEAIEHFLYNTEISVKELEDFLNIKFTEGISHHHSFKKLVEKNNPYAAFELGMEEYRGNIIGYPRYQKSYNYFLIAAEYNHPAANHMLARLLINELVGTLKEEDCLMAYDYLKKAIKYGSVAAINTLGLMYLRGIPPLKKDVKKAIIEFEKAAEEDYAYALNNLGLIHEQKKKMDKAVEYYVKSSNTGESWASNKIGELYRTGTYFDKDLDKAYHYYLLSSDTEISNACYYSYYNLSKYYYLNKESNYYNKEKGIEHLNISSKYNILEASIELLYIYTDEYLIKKDNYTKQLIYLIINKIETHNDYNKEYKKIIDDNLNKIKNKPSINIDTIIN